MGHVLLSAYLHDRLLEYLHFLHDVIDLFSVWHLLKTENIFFESWKERSLNSFKVAFKQETYAVKFFVYQCLLSQSWLYFWYSAVVLIPPHNIKFIQHVVQWCLNRRFYVIKNELVSFSEGLNNLGSGSENVEIVIFIIQERTSFKVWSSPLEPVHQHIYQIRQRLIIFHNHQRESYALLLQTVHNVLNYAELAVQWRLISTLAHPGAILSHKNFNTTIHAV